MTILVMGFFAGWLAATTPAQVCTSHQVQASNGNYYTTHTECVDKK